MSWRESRTRSSASRHALFWPADWNSASCGIVLMKSNCRMLHPAGKHSSNGILRNTSCNHARDSSLRISVRSSFHSDTYSDLSIVEYLKVRTRWHLPVIFPNDIIPPKTKKARRARKNKLCGFWPVLRRLLLFSSQGTAPLSYANEWYQVCTWSIRNSRAGVSFFDMKKAASPNGLATELKRKNFGFLFQG